MLNKFTVAAVLAFQTASASVSDYYFANQDDGLLTTSILPFDDLNGSAAMPTETNLFEWTSTHYGLTHIVANVTPRMLYDTMTLPPSHTTLRIVLFNATTMEEYCTAAFEGPTPFAAPEWDSIGCNYTGMIQNNETI